MRSDKRFIAFVYILCMAALISDYKVLSNIVGSITTLITILYILLSNKKKNEPLEHNASTYILLFFSYFIATSLVNFNPDKWFVTIMVYIMVFTPFFFYNYLYKSKDIKFAKALLAGFFLIWTIFLTLCFITCYTTPDLARMMAAERGSYYNIINGGGYYMGYGSAILCAYLFKRLLRGDFKNGWLKIFMIFEIVLMIATVLVINSYITLVALVAGLLIPTINTFAKSLKSKYISYTITGVVLLIIYFNAGPILGYLIKNTENEFWNRRLAETYESAINGDNTAHVDERERVYQVSIDGFFLSPVLGNGYKNGNAFEGEGSNYNGNHSTVFDSLSQFGIVGALPLFLFLLYPLRRAKARREDWDYLIPFFIMAFLNPVLKSYHVMVILFLIIPCMEMIKTHNRMIKTHNRLYK